MKAAKPRRVLMQERRDQIFKLRAEGWSHGEIAGMIDPPVTATRIGQILSKPRVLKPIRNKNSKRV
jgi:hypothetical protein